MSRAPKLTPSMPLKYKRQEEFARAVGLRGMERIEAYLGVFETEDRRLAGKRSKKLVERPDIEARILYLQEKFCREQVRQAVVDKKWIEAEMVTLYTQAIEGNDKKLALDVLDKLAKTQGMYIQRRESVNVNMDVLKESPDAARQQIIALIAELFPGEDILRNLGPASFPALAEAVEAAQGEQVVDLSPVPEADGNAYAGPDLQKKMYDGGEPEREDVLGGDGVQLPHDGELPGLVGREEVPDTPEVLVRGSEQ